MKENLLKRIFLISAVLFFVGVLLCFALFTVVNVVGAKRLLDNVIEENESGFAAIESQEELVRRVDEVDAALIRISVLSADGTLIADNVLEQGSDAGLDADAAADVLERGVRYKLQRLYGEGETLYVAYTAVKNAALGDIIVVYGLDIDFNDLNFWMLAGACAVGWIVITLATYFITRSYIESATEPLDKLRTMLENVNKGNYSEISYKSRFNDVQEIVSNINVAARNIDDTIKNLKNEQVKNTFILSNVDQGIVAVNSKRKIIISNAAFSDIFGSNPGLVGVDVPRRKRRRARTLAGRMGRDGFDAAVHRRHLRGEYEQDAQRVFRQRVARTQKSAHRDHRLRGAARRAVAFARKAR